MGEAFKYDQSLFAAVSSPEDMAARVMRFAPASDAEALKLLRASYPDCPLSARVAALDFLMRRTKSQAGAAR
ncbi:MAG: hypothetical protein Q8M26_09435 [Pseudolabrys sp.]|nr:hypothetical protein [Pseudolabrys sp.]